MNHQDKSNEHLLVKLAELQRRVAELEDQVAQGQQREVTRHASDAVFRAYFDRATDSLVVHDFSGRLLDANTQACVSLGYSRDELLRLSLFDVETEFDRPRAQDVASRIAPGEMITVAGRQRRKDGSTFPVEVHVSRLDVGGEQYYLALVRDITERTRAEEALRVSERNYKTLTENMKDVVSTIDADTLRFRYVSPSVRALRGYAPEEIIGQPMDAALTEEDRSRFRRFVTERTAAFRTGTLSTDSYFTTQIEQRCKDGSTVPTEIIWHFLRNPVTDAVEIHGVTRDITARKQAELQLRDAWQRLRLAADLADIGVWRWNLVDGTLEWDERLFAWFKVPEAVRLSGLHYDYWRERVHPDDINRLEKCLEQSRLNKSPDDLVYRFLRSDGGVRYIHTAWVVELDERGETLRMLGVCRDITPQRELEESLRAARKAAELANVAKGDFLANMSHEIRTPILAMLGYAEMLRDPQLLEPDQSRAVRTIHRNGEYLLQLINDVLDQAKMEAGKLETEVLPCSPWEILQDAFASLRIRAEEKQVRLDVSLVGRLPRTCVTDPMRVRQILINLIGNAIKFTGSGRRVAVRVSAQTSPQQLRFEIEDEGPGMTAEQVDRLFQPFQQADSSFTRKYGGTGLGLSIAKRLADALGGDIQVRSEFGRGSQFVFFLPLGDIAEVEWQDGSQLDAALAIEKLARDAAPLPTLNGRVLLAEDNADIREVLVYHLSRAGLHVELAENGRVAVEKALLGGWDLILMDIQMPELDGYRATQILRDSGYTGPIIALTAHALRSDLDKSAGSSGLTDYLTKPIGIRELLERLARFLTHAPSRSDSSAPRVIQQSGPHIHGSDQSDDAPALSSSRPIPTYGEQHDLASLVRRYAERLPQQIQSMRAAWENGDRPRLATLAHQLNGSAAMYGLADVGETAGLVAQSIAEGQDHSLVGELIEELEAAVLPERTE